MKPNPLASLDIPKDWPATGTLPNGKAIDLREAWQTMSFSGISMIVVDVPGRGRITPWSNLDGFDGFDLNSDVDGLLSRADLESNGVFDSTLEAWARDKHKIALDLSKDDVDTRAIRYDAYRRFLAETEW